MKKIILVSNDDGVHSEGIKLLAKALKKVGDVFVVAPDREKSAVSHSLTIHRPLRAEQIGSNVYAVDGTPTDCINIAINGILKKKPDLVVSGVNKGENLGDDITYSGTVSAAMEGTLLGIPSIAISLVSRSNFDFKNAVKFGFQLATFILKNGLPKDTLLNVNVPAVSNIKGYRITKQGKRLYGDAVVEKIDPRGKKYYWIGGNVLKWENGKDTDFEAVANQFISITPIHLDMTNHAALKELNTWKL